MNMKLKQSQIKLYNRLIPFIKEKQSKRIFLVEGEGGSGKTATLCYTINKLIKKNFLLTTNLFLIAPTNAAKKVLRNKLIESTENYPNNKKKLIKSLKEDKNISFNTIHSFFKSVQEFDEDGNQFFELTSSKNILSEMKKEQYKMKTEDPTFIIREKNLIILDECSMVDPQKYELFIKLLKEHKNTNIIFMGDRNQLSFIKNINNDKQYLSPVFLNIEQYFKLKGNQRCNDPNISRIINRSKKSVIDSEFNFKIKKKDLCDNVKLIVEKDLKNNVVEKFIKNNNPKIITYSNKRRTELNKLVRKIKYNNKNSYLNDFFFLENEQVIFEENYIQEGIITYYNTDEFVVKDVKFNIVEVISFFNIFKKTFIIQTLNFENDETNYTLKQISKKQIDLFKNIIILLKRCVKDFFIFNILEEHKYFIHKKEKCKCCDENRKYFRFFNDEEYICKECYFNIREYIDKKFICRFCKNINTHENCNKKIRPNISKIKKHIYCNMYRMIQELNNTYNLPLKYSYCITTYKSQGSTYENIIIDYRNIYECNSRNIQNLTRSLYVAVSRAQNKLWFLNYFKW